MHKRNKLGFTLVELMVVIVVIVILASITVVAYLGVKSDSQDSVRAHDMATIKEAILLYDNEFKGVPRVSAYNSAVSSWDQSTSPNWLSWLRRDNGEMPVDPINSAAENRIYRYYCYTATSSQAINGQTTVKINYRENSNKQVTSVFNVTNCLSSVPTL